MSLRHISTSVPVKIEQNLNVPTVYINKHVDSHLLPAWKPPRLVFDSKIIFKLESSVGTPFLAVTAVAASRNLFTKMWIYPLNLIFLQSTHKRVKGGMRSLPGVVWIRHSKELVCSLHDQVMNVQFSQACCTLINPKMRTVPLTITTNL